MIHSLLGKRRYGELLKAVLFMSPALLLCILFTFIPFFRAIWLSFFIVDRNTFKPASFSVSVITREYSTWVRRLSETIT